MNGIVMNRRAVLEAGVAVAIATGLPAATLAAAAPLGTDAASAASARMVAAWVLMRADSTAVRLAWLDADGRVLRELPAVRLEAGAADGSGRPASLWRRAQAAAESAQGPAVCAVAGAWGVSARDCEVRPGGIAHPASGRSVQHTVWVDVV
ncbi:hypothetical protein DFR50_13346 [Roseiarcus fermentans]|uniref:Uncharacterized protein n=1 Tax=Roseiarcus fermentans TaxID=1473586 RepID=A0A366ETQ3_9HYPH|nr:hypothetical protein [Roseiarcus fermentans]RBP05781.1 hypothetical protein DFR50_13346 [Roseiarcus fermentans]